MKASGETPPSLRRLALGLILALGLTALMHGPAPRQTLQLARENGAALALGESRTASDEASLPVPSGQAGKVLRMDVAAVLDHPMPNALIVLRGHLTKQLEVDKYLFSDGTGNIPLTIPTYLFPATPVTPDTPLEVRGTLNREFIEHPELTVSAMSVLGGEDASLDRARHFAVKSLHSQPREGLPVSVRGQLVFFLTEQSFVFRDKTGFIKIAASGLDETLLDFEEGDMLRVLGRTQVREFRQRGEVRVEVQAYRIEPLVTVEPE